MRRARLPPARSTSANRRPRTCDGSPRRLAAGSATSRSCILDRPRHEALIAEVREAGARIKLISDGDLSAAISCAVSGTGVHAVMGIGGAPGGRPDGRRAALPWRRDPGPLPLPERRGAGPRGRDGPRRRGPRLLDRGARLRREPRLRGDRRHGRRPAPGRPLLRRRRADPLAVDGLPDEAGPLHRHRPHVRPGQPAARSGSRAGAARPAAAARFRLPNGRSAAPSRRPRSPRAAGAPIRRSRASPAGRGPAPGRPAAPGRRAARAASRCGNDEVRRLRGVAGARLDGALDVDPVAAEDEQVEVELARAPALAAHGGRTRRSRRFSATSRASAPVAGSGPAGTSSATAALRNSGWSTTPTGSVA